MSLHRRAPRRDANERAIIETLERLGWCVQPLSGRGVPDLLLCKGTGGPGTSWALAEVKARKGVLTPDQIAWRKSWRGPEPFILRSIDDALELSNSQVFGLV